jgi:hypothetical protein
MKRNSKASRLKKRERNNKERIRRGMIVRKKERKEENVLYVLLTVDCDVHV